MSATTQQEQKPEANDQEATKDDDKKTSPSTSNKKAAAAIEDGDEVTPSDKKTTTAVIAAPEKTSSSSSSKTSPFKSDYQPEVVYLYQFCRSGTIPSVSPFCLKVETWLRVAGVKYENVDHRLKLRSKKGKLPFVEINGNQIADSAIIIRELSKHFDRDLDAELSREQRVVGHALESMLEHHTSWVYRWWRTNNPSEFISTSKTDLRQAIKSKLPAGLINFFVKMKFRSRRNDAAIHGIGVHTPDEIYDFGHKDLADLEEFLGDKPYFFGDKPTVLDVVAFSNVAQFLLCQGDKFPPRQFLNDKCPRLVAHVERIKERFWPDWKQACEQLELNPHLPKPEPANAATTDGEEKKDKEKDDDNTEVGDDKDNGKANDKDTAIDANEDELKKKDRKQQDNEKTAAATAAAAAAATVTSSSGN